jgi:hypothetical protein
MVSSLVDRAHGSLDEARGHDIAERGLADLRAVEVDGAAATLIPDPHLAEAPDGLGLDGVPGPDRPQHPLRGARQRQDPRILGVRRAERGLAGFDQRHLEPEAPEEGGQRTAHHPAPGHRDVEVRTRSHGLRPRARRACRPRRPMAISHSARFRGGQRSMASIARPRPTVSGKRSL